MARGALLLAVAVCMLGCAGPSRSPGAMPPAEAASPPPPLPPVPWRDDTLSTLASGSAQWTDPSRDRTITGRWVAPAGGGRALVLVLPGLAQGSQMPTALAETLAHAGFVVLALGHPGNDETIWQGQEARRADFQLAARRVYATSELAERVADVRFVLTAFEREPPPWLPQPRTRLGVVGIGPGAQTAQWLVGERMTHDPPQAPDRRFAAVALIGPYVGFEGPAMSQRYGSITIPLLLAYGLMETDPYGLGMTAQQRRAMVNQLVNARVVELRLSASTVAALQLPGMPQIADGATGPRLPPSTSVQREPTESQRSRARNRRGRCAARCGDDECAIGRWFIQSQRAGSARRAALFDLGVHGGRAARQRGCARLARRSASGAGAVVGAAGRTRGRGGGRSAAQRRGALRVRARIGR